VNEDLPDTTKKKIVAGAALQLPIAGLYFFLYKTGGSYWVGLALASVYEVSLLAIRFLRRVGEKSWAQIGPELEAVMVGWIVSAARDVFSRFTRKYKRRVYEEFNYFNVRGLTLLNAFTLDLTQVFVDLRVSSTHDDAARLLRVLPEASASGTSLWDFLRFEQRSDRSRKALAITGPPGSGKTTLLQHVALTFAKNRQGSHRLRPMLPILLFVREHSADIVKGDPTLAAVAEDHFTRSYWTLKPPKGWFDRQLGKRRTIVLLDGLDEVADTQAREAVANWIDRQIANYPRARFLVTARPQGYRDAPLRRADVLEVMPFRPDQVDRFVRQWYAANAILANGGKRTDVAMRRASNDAKDLLRRLTAAPGLESMTVNPLLLTMITMVHKFRGALPGSRVELYDEICEVLLGRWRQAKGIDDVLRTEQKRLALQPLAAHMMDTKVRDVTASKAVEIITPVLERLGVDPGAEFLREIQDSSGLLQEKEPGVWTFAHLVFQEYLASAQWRKAGPPNEWSRFVEDSWWQETIRLYVAKADASAVVLACLANGGVSAFVLAAECLDEAAEIDRSTRRSAMEWLDTGLSAADDERRHVAAEVRLRRRLKRFQRIRTGSESYIDPEYLTNAEYEYVVARVRVAIQPAHWPGPLCPEASRRDAVEGLRDSDLERLTAFVQGLDVGISTYRLPSPSEAETVSSTSSIGGTVCWSKDGVRVVAGLADLERERLSRMIRNLHLSDEEAVALPDFAALTVDSDFRSHGTRFPILKMPDAALSRSIDADVNDFVLPSCRLLLERGPSDGTSPIDWSINAVVRISRGRKKSLYITGPLSRQLDSLVSAVSHGDFSHAQQISAQLGGDERFEDRRLRRLMCDLIATALCGSPEDTKYAARRALARIVLYTYFGYESGGKVFHRALARDPAAGSLRALRIYWSLLIINERSRGTSIPVDCVRLVRRRVGADADGDR